MQAVLATVISMALSLIIPPLSYFSGAAVGIVSLRRGWREGAFVTVVATGFIALVLTFSLGKPLLALVFSAVVWVPVMVLALVLRSTISLRWTFITAFGLGLVVITIIHILLPDPVNWWLDNVLRPLFSGVMAQGDMSAEQRAGLQQTIEVTAQYMTGILATALVLSSVVSLFIARWWQALLYNPGGFGQEFRTLQLGRPYAMATVAMLAISYLPMGVAALFAREVVMLLLLLAAVQGIALAHALVTLRKAHVAWLVGLYVLMFVALPQVVVALAVIAVMDAWLDLRRRLAPADSSGPPAAPPNDD